MLTKRKKTFAKEFLKDLNKTQAAIRAGYSKKTATKIGSTLSRDVDIRQLIQSGMDERAFRMNLEADTVLANIIRIGEAAEAKGDFANALKANELLGRHLKLFTDKIEIGVDERLSALLTAAENRLRTIEINPPLPTPSPVINRLEH